MSAYQIALQNEAGEPLDGQVEFFAGNDPIGAAGLHKGGTTIDFADIPNGTSKFKFTSPGYSFLSLSSLYDTNTITLVKEDNPTKLILIGGALIGGIWLLSRLKK